MSANIISKRSQQLLVFQLRNCNPFYFIKTKIIFNRKHPKNLINFIYFRLPRIQILPFKKVFLGKTAIQIFILFSRSCGIKYKIIIMLNYLRTMNLLKVSGRLFLSTFKTTCWESLSLFGSQEKLDYSDNYFRRQ